MAASAGTVWSDNTLTVGNVLFAAADRGVRLVVVASSQSALGMPWAGDLIVPDYLPVDEDHPCVPSDAYGVSKLAGEELCRALCRRGAVDVRCLRFPVIWEASNHALHTARRLSAPEQAAKSLWAYIDARDAARATRLATERPSAGFELLNVTSSRAFATEPMPSLVARWFPGVTDVRVPLESDTALFDWRRADTAIGFRSQFVWSPEGIRTEAGLA
jgi:nucleoside-diphosphate-sugar epimerase